MASSLWCPSAILVHPSDAAALYRTPRRSLERRFRRAVHCSPIQYVQNLRVAEARRRLERTNDPVEQIALEVGYENTAFFRRVFKRCTRLTPGAYRRRFQLRPAVAKPPQRSS